jgi:hypothetical protein
MGNLEYIRWKRDVMTEDTTEHSNSASQGSAALIKSYTFTPDSSSNILLGMTIDVTSKYSTTSSDVDSELYVTLTNNTTGKVVNFGGESKQGDTSADTFWSCLRSLSTSYVAASFRVNIGDIPYSNGFNGSVDVGQYGNLVTNNADGSSYTISFYMQAGRGNSGTGTATSYIKDVTLTIDYLENPAVETDSTRFS